jgi:hypothetical protein
MGEPQAIDGVGKQSLSPNLTFKPNTFYILIRDDETYIRRQKQSVS